MKLWDQSTIEKIRKGYYSAEYFNRTKEILIDQKNMQTVTMQIFQKKEDRTLCGISHVKSLFKLGTGYFHNQKWVSKWKDLKIRSLEDGDEINKNEPVMQISGPYVYFAHLESLYLGILARQTRVASNAKEMVTASRGKPVIFFADRFDYFLNQELDGYAARIGGVTDICTHAQGFLIDKKPIGTMPHALIAVHNGNTIKATTEYQKYFSNKPLVVLVDFDNNCVETSSKVANFFGSKLSAIRLDTSENMVDLSMRNLTENKAELHGVNPSLVKQVRVKLDSEGFESVKIIVSGGFNKEKIDWFEKESAPVDVYAVGSAMFDGKNDFTADIVMVGGKQISKSGRGFVKSERLR